MLPSIAIVLLTSCASQVLGSPAQGQDKQALITSTFDVPNTDTNTHDVDSTILAALKTHADPVDALLALQPELAIDLAQRRLLHVFGDEKPQWMTEGDKLRLRRQGKKFSDITDHHEFYERQQVNTFSGHACEISALNVMTEFG